MNGKVLLVSLAVSLAGMVACDGGDPTGPGKDSGSWTVTGSTLTDPDGNVYTTVIIGTQVWTVENLKTTKYNDGSAIPLVTDSAAWAGLSTPAYCWYNNDGAAHKSTYGALYNWFVVAPTNSKAIAPEGWRVPDDDDWRTLMNYCGGQIDAGGKMKEAGTVHWDSPNAEATNVSGFTALPGGCRYLNAFSELGSVGRWWSATDFSLEGALDRDIGCDYGYLYSENLNKRLGISVRLVRDR